MASEFAAVRRQTLERRVQWVRNEVAFARRGVATGAGERPNSSAVVRPAHVTLTAELVEGWLAAADGAGSEVERLRNLVAAERAWQIVGSASEQRSRARAAVPLLFAERCAADGYATLLRRARALGVARSGRRQWPEPLVLLEPMASPATFVRGQRVRSPGLTVEGRDATPFPLVLLPPDHLDSAWLMTTLQHEVGHDVDTELGLSVEVGVWIENFLRGRGVLPERALRWVEWRKELVADLLGLGLAGPGFLITLLGLLQTIGLDATDAGSGTHPLPRARLALLDTVLAWGGGAGGEPGWGALAQHRGLVTAAIADGGVVTGAGATAGAGGGAEANGESWVADARHLGPALLEAPLECLNGGAIGDLFGDVAAETEKTAALAAALCAGTAAADGGGVPWRLLPSAAQFAIVDGGGLGAVHESVLKLAPPAVDVVMPVRQARFLREVVPAMRAPILDEERAARKTPPLELFRGCRRVAFVGATQDGLPGLLARARDAGVGEKDVIEVYFLVDEALWTTEHAGRSAAQLVEDKRKALAVLPGLLDAAGRRWTIAEHGQPFFFASYWDWDAPGGRIHVSPQIWGQDIKYAPAVDYVWEPGEAAPSVAYRAYRDGIDALRGRARVIRRGP